MFNRRAGIWNLTNGFALDENRFGQRGIIGTIMQEYTEEFRDITKGTKSKEALPVAPITLINQRPVGDDLHVRIRFSLVTFFWLILIHVFFNFEILSYAIYVFYALGWLNETFGFLRWKRASDAPHGRTKRARPGTSEKRNWASGNFPIWAPCLAFISNLLTGFHEREGVEWRWKNTDELNDELTWDSKKLMDLWTT